LRARAIPARVVNGFRVSEWSDIGEYFIIRQSDAHAWVEVFYPRAGWVAYDPTPPDPEQNRWTLGFRSLAHLSDLLMFRWDRYVISWSLSEQVLAFGDLRDALVAFGQTLAARAREQSVAALVTAALAGAALLAVLALAVRFGRRLRDREEPAAVRLYRTLRAEILRSGVALEAAEGPSAIKRRLGDLPAVSRVLDLYIACRFAGLPVAPEAVRLAREGL